MSRFVNREATDEIVLANGDKVQVRQRLTAEEDALLTRNLMRMSFNSQNGQPELKEGDWHLQRVRICEAYITAWDFTDDDGKPVEFSHDMIGRLDADTIAEIAVAIDALQKKRRSDFQKKGPKR